MPRLISCAETIPAVLDRTKTQTRRLGWWCDRNGRRLVIPGDHLIVCGKVMGRRADEPIRRLAEVEVTDVRREPLVEITDLDVYAEGCADRVRLWSGYADGPGRYYDERPGDLARWFVGWYCETFRVTTGTEVTVIQWRYLVSHEGPFAEVTS